MGKATSKLLDDKIRACDSTTGPLEPHFRQFSKEWRIDEVVTLHRRFKKNPTGYGLVFSQFEALLSAKGGVKRVRDVFDSIDEDNNGRIDALEFIAALAMCCKGKFEDKTRFCFELVDFNVNGSLCFEELVLMMRSCVSGLLKFMGCVECPTDDEFELLAVDALRSGLNQGASPSESSLLVAFEEGAINFQEFQTWATVNREVLTTVERMTSVNPAITAHDSEQYGDSAEEASTDDDSDFAEEIEGVQHRAMDASDRRSAFELSLEQDRQCAADLDANLKGSGITATTSADHGIVGDNIAGIQAALDNGLGSVTGGDEFMSIKPWVATIKEPTNYMASAHSSEAPEANLDLEWVYGYSAQDQRNNLRYCLNDSNGNTRIVYPAAALAVVYHPAKHTQQYYHGHDDDITALTMHPDGDVCATGQLGRDPSIHVWKPISDKGLAEADPTTLSTFKGFHHRGISQLAFSTKGDKLASVGMDDDHSIAIYDWRQSKLIASGKGDKSKFFACAFVPNTGELVCVGKKVIKFFSISGRGLKGRRGIIGRKGKIQSFLCIGFSGNSLVVGCADGSLYLFKGHKLAKVVKRAHNKAIVAMFSTPQGLITGGRDGTIQWWNTSLKRAGNPVSLEEDWFECEDPRIASVCFAHKGIGKGKRALVGTRSGEIFEIDASEGSNSEADASAGDAHSANASKSTGAGRTFVHRIAKAHYKGELWGLATHPHKHYFVTCGDDKRVRLWDANLRRQLKTRKLPLRARAAAVSPDGMRIAVALFDGKVCVLDGELKFIKYVKDAKKWGSVLQFSPDGKTLAFGSHDSRIYLYNTVNDVYSKRAICKGHSSYINSVDFSSDSRYLQSTCGAYELLYWTVGGNRITSAARMRDTKWATWTATLGWPVQGIWPPGVDGTDINTCARSHSEDMVVCGDDFGQVKMMRFPCLDTQCGDKHYTGHAQHVMSTRFTFDDSHVLSTGGGDKCIFQWACQYEESENVEEDLVDASVPFSSGNAFMDELKIEHRTKLQEAGREGIDTDGMAELFEQQQAAGGGDEFMAVKPWLGTITRMEPKDFDSKSIPKDAPDTDMDLHFVLGYRGNDCRNNLRYTAKGEVCYPAAALGIVYNRRSTQRFFDVHTDDVLSLTMHPQGKIVATGEIGRTPKIIVWDSDTLATLAILKGFHKRGVPLLAFSGGRGDRLASVGLDNDHSIAVYAWEQKVCIATCKGSKSKILGLSFGKDLNSLVTCGVRHLTFWEIKGTTLKSQKGIFGGKKRMQTAVCIGTVGKDTVVTGMADGKLYKWNGHKIADGGVKEGHAAAITAIWPHPDGLVTGAKDGTIIMWDKDLEPVGNKFSVGRMEWGLGDPTVAEDQDKVGDGESKKDDSRNNNETIGSQGCSVQSICMKDGKLLIGTKGCEIIELDIKEHKRNIKETQKKFGGSEETKVRINTPMLHAHCKGETWGLAVHPQDDQFMTCGDDATGRLWDAYDIYLKATIQFKKQVRACTFSPYEMMEESTQTDGVDTTCHVAFGLFNGWVVICRDDLLPIHDKDANKAGGADGSGAGKKKHKNTSKLDSSKVIAEFKCCKEWIQDLKYSPTGEMLAVSSHDNRIYLVKINRKASMLKDIYNHKDRIVCAGHSSYITHIDWSHDGRYLQSTCGAYELLFWDTSDTPEKKAHQVYASQVYASQMKETMWQTFSVPLGWHVQGIWPPNVDGTDINAVERSHGRSGGKGSAEGKMIAIADDFGMVKLQRFPCVSNTQIAKYYRGHSAHVTNVAFYNDDDFLVSTGGGDNCIFLWKTDYVAGAEDEEADESTEGSLSEPHEAKLHAEIVTSLSNNDLLEQMPMGGIGGGDEFMAIKPWLGAISEPSSWSSQPDSYEEPPNDLDLNFVYGFSSHIRNSVFFDKQGNYVYAAAATGIAYDPNEHTQRFNRTLTDDILSCALSPDGNTCAMGERGRKPKVCIWDVHSGNTLLTIGGFHRRGVCLLAWSPSGSMLATIGLDNDHSLAVYNAKTGDLIASAKGHQSTVLDLLFKSESEIIIVGVKHAKFFTLSRRQLKGKRGIFGKQGKIQPILCVASLGTNVVTGQADGTLYLWQGRNCQMQTEKAKQKGGKVVGHNGPVTSIWTMAREGVVSGGRDGIVIVWDRTLTQLKRFNIATLKGSAPIAKLGSNLGGRERVVLPCGIQSICARDNQILVATKSGALITFSSDNEDVSESDTNRVIEGHFVGETWGLARHPSKDEFVTCGDDMTLRRWDGAHRRAISVVKLDAKARAVDYAPDAAHIAVGMYSGRVEIFDGQLGELVKGISVCSEWIQDVKYSPFPGRRLAVSSHDNNIYVFDRKSYTRTAVLRGHSSYITHMDFSADGRFLQSNCGAYELLFWDVDRGRQITSASSLRDVHWETWTCTLGWPVQGIWPPEADGTDVNSVDRSPDKNLLVTADDSGKVKLFRYPAPQTEGSAFRTGEGHSSHVTNARFLANGKTTVTTGGNDRCVFQWNVVPAKVRKKRGRGGSRPPAPQARSSHRPRLPPNGTGKKPRSQQRRRRR